MNQHRPSHSSAAAALLLTALVACGKTPEPTAAKPPASAATANVSDIDVTEHVKTALLQTESLKGLDITVVTLKGDVRLSGMLDSQSQIDEALRVARAAEGAHTIHDELTIKK
jgi:osmotically-inducible protein OsmY